MNEIKTDKTEKIVMLGNCSVGKTSLVMQFYRKSFKNKSKSTIGGNYISKEISTKNGEVTLHIWDTAGEERFRSLLPMYTRGAQAAIIVFNLHDQNSFDSIQEWVEYIQKSELYRCKIYIAANQIDLGQTALLSKARSWANSNQYKFFVTSANNYESVSEMFQCIAEEFNGNDSYRVKTQTYQLQQRRKQKCC